MRIWDEARLPNSCSAGGPGSAAAAGSVDWRLVPECFAADWSSGRAVDSILWNESKLISDAGQRSRQLTSLESPCDMRARVLAKVVFPVESLAALNAAVLFVPRVDDRVETQLLLPLEGLQAVAQVGPVRVVALLVPGEVVFALQGRIADFTNEPPFHVLVADHVLVENFSVELTSVTRIQRKHPTDSLFRVRHLTFRAHEQHRPVQGELQPDFAGFGSRLLLLRRLLLLLFLGGRIHGLCRLHVVDLVLLDWLNDVGDRRC